MWPFEPVKENLHDSWEVCWSTDWEVTNITLLIFFTWGSMLLHSVATLAKKLFYHSFKIFPTWIHGYLYLKFTSTNHLTASQFFKKNEGCLINIPAADILYNYSSSCLSRSIFSVPALFLQRHVCILLSVDSKFSYFI